MSRLQVFLVHDGVAAPPKDWVKVGGPDGEAGKDWFTVDAVDHDEALARAYAEDVHSASKSRRLWAEVAR